MEFRKSMLSTGCSSYKLAPCRTNTTQTPSRQDVVSIVPYYNIHTFLFFLCKKAPWNTTRLSAIFYLCKKKNPTNRALVRKNAYICGCIKAFTVQVVKSPIKSRGRRLMLIFVLKSFDAERCRYDSKQAWEFVSSVHSVKGVWRCLLLDGLERTRLTLF